MVMWRYLKLGKKVKVEPMSRDHDQLPCRCQARGTGIKAGIVGETFVLLSWSWSCSSWKIWRIVPSYGGLTVFSIFVGISYCLPASTVFLFQHCKRLFYGQYRWLLVVCLFVWNIARCIPENELGALIVTGKFHSNNCSTVIFYARNLVYAWSIFPISGTIVHKFLLDCFIHPLLDNSVDFFLV